MEQLVDFNTAKALKEAGFNIPTTASFHYNSQQKLCIGFEVDAEDYNEFPPQPFIWYSRPTIEQVDRWLRERHYLHAYLRVERGNWRYSILEVVTSKPLGDSDHNYSSYDLALTDSIYSRLEIVKERGK